MERRYSDDVITSEQESSRHAYVEQSSEEQSADSSRTPSRPGSPGGGGPKPKERGRVRFNSNSEVNDETNQRSSFPLRDRHAVPPVLQIPSLVKTSPGHSRDGSSTTLVRHTAEHDNVTKVADKGKARAPSPVQKPRQPALRNNSNSSFTGTLEDVDNDGSDNQTEKAFSALAAQKRAQKMATLVGSHSAPASRRNSIEEVEETEDSSSPPHGRAGFPVRIDDIPLVDVGKRTYDAPDSESEDEHDTAKPMKRSKSTSSSEAHKLVRAYTRKELSNSLRVSNGQSSGLVSGQVTPSEEQDPQDYVARPQQFRGGVLSSLLKLYNTHNTNGYAQRGSSGESATSPSETPTPGTSGTTTPSKKNPKWYKHNHQSRDTLAGLVEASAKLSTPAGGRVGIEAQHRPASVISGSGRRSPGTRLMDSTIGKLARPRLEDEIRITVHIAEILSRQKYLIRLCKALMSYGAPTHRLEEYLKMTARVLEIEAQFLYIPGCMLISFDDSSTHTTEVKLVRTAQGVDLGKLKDVHEIYKEVVHDVIGVEEATQRLDAIIHQKQKYHRWILVLVYGLASASVGPFGFQARLIDLPIAFLLGSILGVLQLILAPKSELYSNVFEISAAVLTSFLARAFGSIPFGGDGGRLFCFSGLAQSAIALILPGYMVLCGSLELQSKSMVAGSVRMVYAIIYSLFLGFGIMIGTAFYGLMDPNATSETQCSNPMNEYYRFFFVPIFTLCLCIINQAKWKQIPIMLTIAFIGYIVNFFTAKRFPSNAQISNTLGALAIGFMGNLYSRMRHGVAAAALLPAIFVQVPSGLAASGSLLAGLSSANQITNSSTYANGAAMINGPSSVSVSPADLNSIVLNVGYTMIQVAIGITVGLFLSALIIYPFGKKRSGLFSF